MRTKELQRRSENLGDEEKQSILYLALVSEGKHARVKTLFFSFKIFFDLLDAAFVKPANITFERYKLLSR